MVRWILRHVIKEVKHRLKRITLLDHVKNCATKHLWHLNPVPLHFTIFNAGVSITVCINMRYNVVGCLKVFDIIILKMSNKSFVSWVRLAEGVNFTCHCRCYVSVICNNIIHFNLLCEYCVG